MLGQNILSQLVSQITMTTLNQSDVQAEEYTYVDMNSDMLDVSVCQDH